MTARPHLTTSTGCWFSCYERADGQVDYTFWRFDTELETGTCSEAEMYLRFDALDHAASLPLQ